MQTFFFNNWFSFLEAEEEEEQEEPEEELPKLKKQRSGQTKIANIIGW